MIKHNDMIEFKVGQLLKFKLFNKGSIIEGTFVEMFDEDIITIHTTKDDVYLKN